jgi:hypothetical protein
LNEWRLEDFGILKTEQTKSHFMKTSNKQSIRFWLFVPILLTALIWSSGCARFARQHPDPLAGWHFCSLNNLDTNKTVSDDYHAYINKLPPKERKDVGSVFYFEDGTGRHAVAIEVSINGIFEGTEWKHVLIYDNENKRIKVIKYVKGYYSL